MGSVDDSAQHLQEKEDAEKQAGTSSLLLYWLDFFFSGLKKMFFDHLLH